MYQLVFYVPESHLEVVKTAVFATGAGKVGQYDHCCWQVKGQGQFRPLAGSDPFLGNEGKVEQVEEYRVELVVSDEDLNTAVEALVSSHPYETPAFSYWRIQVSS